MNKQKDVPAQDAIKRVDDLMTEYLTKNPQLASALATFDVAQEEYRKSLLAMTSSRIVTSGTANIEV